MLVCSQDLPMLGTRGGVLWRWTAGFLPWRGLGSVWGIGSAASMGGGTILRPVRGGCQGLPVGCPLQE